jgi:uncharacterized protein YggE
MNERWRFGIAGVVLGLAVALAIPLSAQSPDEGSADRTVTVMGTAVVKSAPDEAVISLGVHTEAEGAKAAMEQNAERMEAVVRALVNAGVAAEDISTSNISLWPQYDSNGVNVTGYVAENSLSVTVRDIDEVGDVIDAGIAAGANLAGGVMFQLSDDNQGVEQALRMAVDDAKAKAEALADQAGASLGRVVRIDETMSGAPPIYYEERAVAADAGGATTPILPSDVETSVTVTVVWALA